MKSKGFTLIELLAVIVILAIIALIATPIILNIIDDAKANSIKSSANLYKKALELYISNSELNKVKITPGTYPITEDGDLCIGIIEKDICNGEVIKIEVKGNKPNDGIIIDESNVQIDYLEINGYIYHNKYIIEKTIKENIESNDGIITIDGSKTGILSNYRIYGNSYQPIYIGKNLIDINSYTTDTDGYIRISTENLIIGQTYTISSKKPFNWFKISNYRSGYNSVQLKNSNGITAFTFTMTKNENISETAPQYIFMSFLEPTDFSKDINDFINANIQIEEGTEATEYEPYKEQKYSIYLKEPLRCVGEICDYIDYKSGKVIRYIKEIDNDPTKTIEENYEVLIEPIIENIKLPKISINEGVSNIFIETDIKPNKVSVNYYK